MVCLFALQLTVELCCVHMAMLESGSASLVGYSSTCFWVVCLCFRHPVRYCHFDERELVVGHVPYVKHHYNMYDFDTGLHQRYHLKHKVNSNSSRFYSAVYHQQGWALHTLLNQCKCIHETFEIIYKHISVFLSHHACAHSPHTCTHTHTLTHTYTHTHMYTHYACTHTHTQCAHTHTHAHTHTPYTHTHTLHCFLFSFQAPRLSPCVRLLGWPDHSGCTRNLFVLIRRAARLQLQHCFGCAVRSSVEGQLRETGHSVTSTEEHCLYGGAAPCCGLALYGWSAKRVV